MEKNEENDASIDLYDILYDMQKGFFDGLSGFSGLASSFPLYFP